MKNVTISEVYLPQLICFVSDGLDLFRYYASLLSTSSFNGSYQLVSTPFCVDPLWVSRNEQDPGDESCMTELNDNYMDLDFDCGAFPHGEPESRLQSPLR